MPSRKGFIVIGLGALFAAPLLWSLSAEAKSVTCGISNNGQGLIVFFTQQTYSVQCVPSAHVRDVDASAGYRDPGESRASRLRGQLSASRSACGVPSSSPCARTPAAGAHTGAHGCRGSGGDARARTPWCQGASAHSRTASFARVCNERRQRANTATRSRCLVCSAGTRSGADV